MTNKFQMLLNINAIMKQRVEKQFSDLVKQREAVKFEVENLTNGILSQKISLEAQAEADPLSVNLLVNWEEAQYRKIKALRIQEQSLMEEQAPLRKELAAAFVKEKMLLTKLKEEKKELSLKTEKEYAEKTQSIWLQNNYNSA